MARLTRGNHLQPEWRLLCDLVPITTRLLHDRALQRRREPSLADLTSMLGHQRPSNTISYSLGLQHQLHGTVLEASYVAQGQANRAQEIKRALEAYKILPLRHFAPDDAIRLTALVTLEAEDGTEKRVFVGPQAGGLKVTDDGSEVVVRVCDEGTGIPLVARGTYSDGRRADLSAQVAWNATPAGIVAIVIAFAALSDLALPPPRLVLAILVRAAFFYLPLLVGPALLERYAIRRVAR